MVVKCSIHLLNVDVFMPCDPCPSMCVSGQVHISGHSRIQDKYGPSKSTKTNIYSVAILRFCNIHIVALVSKCDGVVL